MARRSVLHHTVPRFYLRRFADYDEQLRALDRANGRVFGPVSVAVLGAESNFHTIYVDGTPSDEVEKIVSEVEGPHAGGLRSLDERFPPTHAVRAEVASFVAFQFVRSSRWRQMSLKVSAEMLKWSGKMQASTMRHQLSPEVTRALAKEIFGSDDLTDAEIDELLASIEEGDYELQIDPQEHIREMLDMLRDPEPAEILAARAWSMLYSRHPWEFITSDHPVALRGDGPLGIESAEEVCVPLDRTRALLMSWDERKDGKRYAVGQREVEEINRGTREASRRFAYAHPQTRTVLLTG